MHTPLSFTTCIFTPYDSFLPMNILPRTSQLFASRYTTRIVSRSLLSIPTQASNSIRTFQTTASIKMPNKHNNKEGKEHISKESASAADEGHQFQAGNTTDRKEDEWKHNPPYSIHGDDENFNAVWEGGCHCGKVQYQLSREKPLAAKYCHCTTCQRLHGVSLIHPLALPHD